MHDLRLNHIRGVAVCITNFASANVEIGLPFAFKDRKRCIRLSKALFATVFFFYRHIEVATGTGGVEIGNFKCPRGPQTGKLHSHFV